jgi:hypothetical protein
VIGAAVKVMRIATGEETEEADSTKSAAAELGGLGGISFLFNEGSSRGTWGLSLIVAGARTPAPVLCL